MRHYEIVLLVHPDQSEQVPAMVDRYKGMISAGGGGVFKSTDGAATWNAASSKAADTSRVFRCGPTRRVCCWSRPPSISIRPMRPYCGTFLQKFK